MAQPMQGIKVIDLSRILAGPLCTMTLADFGAEVLKVESRDGDETRAWLPPVTEDGVSTYYSAVNRNKQAIVVDFNNSAELTELREIIRDADVVVENFRPGVLAKFGLDYESLRASNPALVYCSISGFGDGLGASLPGFDLLVQAVGGLMSITGESEGTPSKVGVALVDVLAAQNATTGILLALRERDISGQGQNVGISLMTSLLAGLTNQASSTAVTGNPPPRLGNAHPSIAPYETFATSDGVMVIAVGNNRQFTALGTELGLTDLPQDPRFADNLSRVQHRQELKDLIEEVTRQGSAAQWTNRLMEVGVPAGKVNSVLEALEFADELGLEPVVTINDLKTGRSSRQIANPIVLSRTKPTYRLVPPALGEHQHIFLSTTSL
ncbi:CaiB/BaiF CoA transferase family protein [Glutamicibacter sp. 287]|uniref:CaiB/BaiF CoA transferase family protein n=1 Tax=unclassified Glutamicibacter TaxID=2627139 RepID=UPI000BB896C4|nr:CoA transferase [Glutamicibacter sp. BW80]PCC27189.1 carnitine dehydratase [Glutamicibacter sp. BW80]